MFLEFFEEVACGILMAHVKDKNAWWTLTSVSACKPHGKSVEMQVGSRRFDKRQDCAGGLIQY